VDQLRSWLPHGTHAPHCALLDYDSSPQFKYIDGPVDDRTSSSSWFWIAQWAYVTPTLRSNPHLVFPTDLKILDNSHASRYFFLALISVISRLPALERSQTLRALVFSPRRLSILVHEWHFLHVP
jgi:hypothetical protein